jgi:hypothetical protein
MVLSAPAQPAAAGKQPATDPSPAAAAAASVLANPVQAPDSQLAPTGTAASSAQTQETSLVSGSGPVAADGGSVQDTSGGTDQPVMAKDAVDSLFAGWDGNVLLDT